MSELSLGKIRHEKIILRRASNLQNDERGHPKHSRRTHSSLAAFGGSKQTMEARHEQWCGGIGNVSRAIRCHFFWCCAAGLHRSTKNTQAKNQQQRKASQNFWPRPPPSSDPPPQRPRHRDGAEITRYVPHSLANRRIPPADRGGTGTGRYRRAKRTLVLPFRSRSAFCL